MLRDSGGSGGESAARAVNRSLIAALAIALLSSVCFAQLAIGPSLAPGQTLHGRFEQARNLKGITSTLKSDGTFVLAPGRGLIWRIQDPIQTTTVITPAGIRQIVNGSEVQRIEAAKVPFIAHFYDMLNGALMGDWTAMRHDFSVETTGNRGAWRTLLTPLRPNDPIAGVLASIVISGGKMVDGVEIRRTNGDSERIAFLDQAVSGVALSGDDARLLNDKNISPAN
jgi:Outer membrane lipoprotein carrier protein LolA-like